MDPENGGPGGGFINDAPPHWVEPAKVVSGTCAIGVTPMVGRQIGGIVGVIVMVGVDVTVRVSVAVLVGTGVFAAGVSVGSGVSLGTGVLGTGVFVGGQGAAHASQQLAKPVAQPWPPLGTRHLSALDFTEHLFSPFAVVRQQVTQPGGRPQVDFRAHRFTAAAQDFDSVPSLTAWLTTLLAQLT